MTQATQQYRAAIFVGVDRPLEIRTGNLPTLGDGTLLVRITCCTLCGSDLHTILGHRDGPTPSILGHEMIGIVEEIGPQPIFDIEQSPIRRGQRVTWSIAASCGDCDRCRADLPQKCHQLFKYGHEAVSEAGPDGGLADHCVLRPGSAIVALPTDVADEVLCPANCATATVMAAVRKSGSLRGKRVLILGAGMLGLTAAAIAQDGGAKTICVVDPIASRETLAKRFGASGFQTRLSDSNDKYDVIFELSGQVEAVKAAYDQAEVGASIVLVGTVSPTADIAVNPEQIVRRCLSIHGVHNYRPADLGAAVEFLVRRQDFPFASLVEKQFSLAEINDAVRYAVDHRPIRISIRPS